MSYKRGIYLGKAVTDGKDVRVKASLPWTSNVSSVGNNAKGCSPEPTAAGNFRDNCHRGKVAIDNGTVCRKSLSHGKDALPGVFKTSGRYSFKEDAIEDGVPSRVEDAAKEPVIT
jgi:hypothetical protein